MAEDEPRHGDAPEHGHDPENADQPEPAEPETRLLGSGAPASGEGRTSDSADGAAAEGEPFGQPPAAEPSSKESPSDESWPEASPSETSPSETSPSETSPSETSPSETVPSAELFRAAPPPPGRPPGLPPPGLPDTAETHAIGPDDATAVHPAASDPWAETAPPLEPGDPRVGPTGTTIMPSVPPGPPPADGPETRPRWSARAQVPQAPSDDTVAEGEGYYEEPPGRGVAAPILVGLAVVALLVAIGFGGWLVIRGLQGTSPAPPPATTQPPATTPPHTTATTKASPTVTTTARAAVPVPDLRLQDYTAAANTLTGLGLVPQRVNEPSTTVPAGKVIRTDPSGGFVLSGATVSVVVSSGPPASPSPSPSPKKS